MADVIITPASGLIDFQNVSGISSATIQLDGNGNLALSAAGGDIQIGDTSSDIFIGDGINNVDLIFEEDGEIRGLTGKTITLGQSDSFISFAGDITGNITVTGTVDGRDIASDGSKLDGIESGATADQTASEILTAIKTVDGASSGLDADTLDGIQGASFVRNDVGSQEVQSYLTINDAGNFSVLEFEDSSNVQRAHVYHANSGGYAGIGVFDSSGANRKDLLLYQNGTITWNNNTVWHAGNDGAGSGLDADLLDGVQAWSFLRSDAADTATGKITFSGGHEAQATFLSGAQNFDNIKTSGFFSLYNVNASGHTNAPFQYGAMISVSNTASSLGMGMQLANERLGNGLYVRGMNDSNDAWSSWAEVWTSNTDGAGSGLDADTLDGIQGASFLRSDANDTWSGNIETTSTNGIRFGSANQTDGNDGYIAAGKFATGLNIVGTQTQSGTGRQIRIYGSLIDANGSAYWFAGNDGAGSGLDADTLDGAQPSVSASNSTIVQRHSSGYIYANYFNTTPNDVTSGVTKVLVETGNDGFMRHGTADAIRSFINVESGATADQTASEILTAIKTVDGAGSGLDADLLDGISSASFLRSDANDTLSAIITGHASDTEVFRLRSSTYSTKYIYYGGWSTANSNDIARIRSSGNLHIDSPANGDLYFNWYASNRTIYLGNAGQTVRAAGSNIVWHAGNDGSGSGLDADTLDGQNLDANANANTVVSRNGAADITCRLLRPNYGNDNYINGALAFRTNNSTDNYVRFCNDTSLIRTYLGVTATASDTNYLRSNAFDVFEGTTSGHYLRFQCFSGRTANSSSANLFPLEVFQATANADAAIAFHINGDYAAYFGLDGTTNDLFYGGWSAGAAKYKIWHAGNDGSGSGLDADTLDGISSASFMRSDASTSTTGNLTVNGVIFANEIRDRTGSQLVLNAGEAEGKFSGQTGELVYLNAEGGILVSTPDTGHSNFESGYTQDSTRITGTYITIDGNTAWHAGNDGSGSGLDADLWDGNQFASYLNQAVLTTSSPSFNQVITTNNGNGTNVRIGDDAWIGDINAANTIRVQGVQNGANGYIVFGNSNTTALGRAGTGALTYGGSTIWHAGNDGAGSGLDADTIDGTQLSNLMTLSGTQTITGDKDFDGTLTYDLINGPNSDTRDKIRVWTASSYSIGMKSGFSYGGLGNAGTEYAMTFQMSNTTYRGWWWGDNAHTDAQGAMALTTEGRATIAHSLRIGYGESDSVVPGATHRLDVSGSILATGDITAFSDINLKENIEVIPNALDKVSHIRGVTFIRKDLDDKSRKSGVIAQEVEKVLPEVVTTTEDGTKTVAYGNLVGLLIESIKELKAEVEELKKERN